MISFLKRTGLIFLLISLLACNKKNTSTTPPLNENDKIKIEKFASELTSSLEAKQYDVIRKSWNNQLFYNSLGKLSDIEKNFYRHQIDDAFGGIIKSGHIDLINDLKYNNGSVSSSSVNFTQNWGEINYILKFDQKLTFIKYKAIIHEGNVYLVDCFMDHLDDWQSNITKDVLNLLVPKRQQTKEREKALKGLMRAEKYFEENNVSKGLELLYLIPDNYRMNHNVTYYAINIAFSTDIKELRKVVKWEEDKRPYIYVDYLYSVLFDRPEELSNVVDALKIKYNTNDPIVDSLKTFHYEW